MFCKLNEYCVLPDIIDDKENPPKKQVYFYHKMYCVLYIVSRKLWCELYIINLLKCTMFCKLNEYCVLQDIIDDKENPRKKQVYLYHKII